VAAQGGQDGAFRRIHPRWRSGAPWAEKVVVLLDETTPTRDRITVRLAGAVN
jgi:hypothetical protein